MFIRGGGGTVGHRRKPFLECLHNWLGVYTTGPPAATPPPKTEKTNVLK